MAIYSAPFRLTGQTASDIKVGGAYGFYFTTGVYVIKLVNKSENHFFYATLQSAGFDICANEDGVIEPGNYKTISTGLYLDEQQEPPFAPDEVEPIITPELQIRPRSGLAFKYGVTVLNSPGTIDYDYRYPNEIKVILINHGKYPFEYKNGDRIAQGVVALTVQTPSIPTKDTNRTGGLGSTGK
jgi:dUTP pyrophosphatase